MARCTTLEDVLRVLRARADDYRRLGITHMAVFGSFARGEAGEGSDVDLVIDLDPEARLSLFDLFDVEDAAASSLGRKVDLLTRRSLKPRLARRIEEEAVNVF